MAWQGLRENFGYRPLSEGGLRQVLEQFETYPATDVLHTISKVLSRHQTMPSVATFLSLIPTRQTRKKPPPLPTNESWEKASSVLRRLIEELGKDNPLRGAALARAIGYEPEDDNDNQ